MASLSYKNSRLVRSLDSKTGARKGFGLDNATEVVSARYFAFVFCCLSSHIFIIAQIRHLLDTECKL